MQLQSILVVTTAGLPAEFEAVFERRRCLVTRCSTAAEALQIITEKTFDLAFVDLNLPEPGPFELLRQLQVQNRPTLVVGLAGAQTAGAGLKLVQAGAFDVLRAPFCAEMLEAVWHQAEAARRITAENQYYRTVSNGSEELIGRSQPMQAILQSQSQWASGKPVLITGEPGTGKSLLACHIQRRSRRNPFIQADCRQHPDSLLELKLWGAASSQAAPVVWNQPGYLELARGGTLCLDEISGLGANVQARLLRLLRESPAGAPPEVQLLCTAGDLTERLKSGAFSTELYQCFTPVTLPPMRARGGDVLLLAEYFLRQHAAHSGQPLLRLEAEAREALSAWPWPGNVRELRYCIERAALCCSGSTISAQALGLGVVQASSLPSGQASGLPVTGGTPVLAPAADRLAPIAAAVLRDQIAFSVGAPLDEVEREMILRTVALTKGNRTKAAQMLGISVRTLYTKLSDHEQLQSARQPSNAELPAMSTL